MVIAATLKVNILQLKCAICKNHLKTAPVFVISNGSSICEKCKSASNKPSFRNHLYEKVVEDALFPCEYAPRGCTAQLKFNNTVEHESVCKFQNCKCPVADVIFFSGRGLCSWEGRPIDLPKHFNHDDEDHYVDEIANENFQFEKCSKVLKLVQVKKRNFLMLIDALTTNIYIEVFNLYEGDRVKYRFSLYKPEAKHELQLRKEECTRVLREDEKRIIKYDKRIISKLLGRQEAFQVSIYFYIGDD